MISNVKELRLIFTAIANPRLASARIHARNVSGAAKWINFILDPKIGAQLSNFNRYATPNSASMPMIADKDRSNVAVYPTADQLKVIESQRDLGKSERIYKDIWTGVKSR